MKRKIIKYSIKDFKKNAHLFIFTFMHVADVTFLHIAFQGICIFQSVHAFFGFLTHDMALQAACSTCSVISADFLL